MSPSAALLTCLKLALGLALAGSGSPARRSPRLPVRLDPYLRGLEPRATRLLEPKESPLVPIRLVDRLLRPSLDEGGRPGLLCGGLGRDGRLTQQVERRQARRLEDLPALADLICLAVTAGEAPL